MDRPLNQASSFTDYIPGVHVDRMNFATSNSKRPGPSTDAYNAAKRRQRDQFRTEDSLFRGESEDSEDEQATDPYQRAPRDHANHSNYAGVEPGSTSATSQSVTTSVSSTQRSNGSTRTKDQSTSAATKTASQKVVVKEEDETPTEAAWMKLLPTSEKVTIYVGRRNRPLVTSRTDLAKSDILASYIIEDTLTGPYIMRPQLMEIDHKDFNAVMQFLHTEEFTPELVEKENDEPSCLEGLRREKAYSQELVRLGRIYIIAQTFQITALEDLIFKKVSQVDRKLFSTKSVIELAGGIFSNERGTNLRGNPSPDNSQQQRNDETMVKDRLERWIIMHLANHMQEVLCTHKDAFWSVARRTKKNMFCARFFEASAEIYRANDGDVRGVVIDLDE